VLTTNKIYDAFYDHHTSQKVFLHSHSYTSNALVCRTALATLTIFETQNVLENNTRLAAKIAELSKQFMYTNTHEKRHVNAPTRQCRLFQPSYVITHEELNFMFDIAWQAITLCNRDIQFHFEI
jgi:adenosylmethionine-8-amino-7-oxononanoate aminotransferase